MVPIGKILSTSFLLLLITLPPATASPDDKALELRVHGDTVFMLDLYGKLINDPSMEKNGGNLFFSPSSLSTALAMTWAGACEETERQMARVLHLAQPPEETHETFAQLKQDLVSANALWVQKGRPILPEYLQLIRKYYDGSASELDFRNAAEKSRKTINAWVEEKTMGKIEELIKADNVSPMIELVLTNALYFNEEWANSFDPKHTALRPFEVSEEETVQVHMMYQYFRVGYAMNDDVEIMRMPFAGRKMSLVILLPRSGLEALEKSLSAEKLKEWTADLAEQELGIFLPRFKMTSRFELKKILTALGMRDAFSREHADFSGMTGKRDLFIDEVIHQAALEMDEQGAEAAAGSAVMMKKRGRAFSANRPFLFFIEDSGTGAILFMGRLKNPSKL